MKFRDLLSALSVVVGSGLLFFISVALRARASDSIAAPTIFGAVHGHDGVPIQGATVRIWTANVRVGYSPFCPSCYADCGKSAKTGAGGEFVIGPVDRTLVFRVLLVAKGCEPKFVKVDPLKNEALDVTLVPRPQIPDDVRRLLSGRVVGPRGAPIAAALVEPFGWKTGDRRSWDDIPGTDPLAVTDEQGRFQIVVGKAVESLDLQITARAFAKKIFALVPTGMKENGLELAEGATVRGRVLDHGRPAAGVEVGLAQANRAVMHFLGPAKIGTDSHGEFLFANVSAADDYYVYGIMTSLNDRGGISERLIHVGADGSEAIVGDFVVEPAFRLTGRIALSDGQPVPAHTKVLISREQAWDTQLVEADAKGTFLATGIPRGAISIVAELPGFRSSKQNKSLNPLTESGLLGMVEADTDVQVLLLEPANKPIAPRPPETHDAEKIGEAYKRLKTKPPMGVIADRVAPSTPAPAGEQHGTPSPK